MTGLVMVGDDGTVCEGDACLLPTAAPADRPAAASSAAGSWGSGPTESDPQPGSFDGA